MLIGIGLAMVLLLEMVSHLRRTVMTTQDKTMMIIVWGLWTKVGWLRVSGWFDSTMNENRELLKHKTKVLLYKKNEGIHMNNCHGTLHSLMSPLFYFCRQVNQKSKLIQILFPNSNSVSIIGHYKATRTFLRLSSTPPPLDEWVCNSTRRHSMKFAIN